MKEVSDALQKMLTSLSGVYNESQPLDVVKGDEPGVTPQGRVHVATTPSKGYTHESLEDVEELRYLIDQLSHLVEHHRETDIVKRYEQQLEYDEAPLLAGFVYNIVEDAFVDKNRTDRFRGLRPSAAFRADILMNHRMRTPIDQLDPSHARVEALVQLSISGYVKGIDDVDDDVREFCAWARIRLNDARRETDYTKRNEITNELTERLIAETANLALAEEYIEAGYLPTDDLKLGSYETNVDDALAEVMENAMGDASGSIGDGIDGDNSESMPDMPNVPAMDGDEEAPDYYYASWVKWALLGGLAVIGLTLAALWYLGVISGWLFIGIVGLLALLLWLLKRLLEGMAAAALEQWQQECAAASGGGSDGSSGSGGSTGSGGSDGSEPISREAFEQAMEELSEQSASGESRDWYDVGEDVDYTESSEEMDDRLEQLREMEAANLTDLESDRDARLRNTRDTSGKTRDLIKQRGLDREIEDAFRQLKTRDREVPRRRGQRINTRNVVRRRAGDTSENRLFYHQKRAEVGDRAIGVAIDLSGSMDSQEARVALGALSIATEIIGDDLVVRGFQTGGTHSTTGYSSGYVNLPLITSPDEEFKWEYLSLVRSSGRTPTADGIRGTQSVLKKCSKPEKVMIVITDGMPNVTTDGATGDTEARQEAKEYVRKSQRNGVKMIGMGVGHEIDEQTMSYMFGSDGYVMINEDNLAEKLVEIYHSQMRVT